MKAILVGIDDSSRAPVALARASMLARQHGGVLHVMRVMPRGATATDCRDALEALRSARSGEAAPDVEFDVVEGDPPTALAERAKAIGADLIVVGGHGRVSWTDAVFGTTAEALLRHSTTPLLIARTDPPYAYRRAIAAIASDDSVRVAVGLALLIGAKSLRAVHAFELPFEAQVIGGEVTATIKAEESRAFRERIERIADHPTGLEIHAVTIEGDPISAIVQACQPGPSELLILTTHGRSGLRWLARGSVADTAVEQISGDILVGRLAHR